MSTKRRSRQLTALLTRFSLERLTALPARELRITWATMATLARVALTPFIVYAMSEQRWGGAFGIFIGASLSDMLDGFLARLCNEKTFLGACLDPIADKFLLVTCFATLAFVQSPLFTIPKWFVWLVLCKELLQLLGAVGVYWYNGYISIQPTLLGKGTTLFQMGFIAWLFACYFFCWLPTKTYYTMLGLMVVLVCASFAQYAYVGMQAVLHKPHAHG